MRPLIMSLVAAPLLAGGGFAVGVAVTPTSASAGIHDTGRTMPVLEAIARGHVDRLEKDQSVKNAIAFYGQALAVALTVPADRSMHAAVRRYNDAMRCVYTLAAPRVADPILDDMRRDMITTQREENAYERLLRETSAVPAARPEEMPCVL